MTQLKEFTSIDEIKQAIKAGNKVWYHNSFYTVKLDKYGNYIIKCSQTNKFEFLSKDHNLTEFYIF
jgi:hypothetical protein